MRGERGMLVQDTTWASPEWTKAEREKRERESERERMDLKMQLFNFTPSNEHFQNIGEPSLIYSALGSYH